MATERERVKSAVADKDDNDPEYAAKLAEGRAKAAEIDRNDGMQTHLHRISVLGVWVIGLLIVAGVSTWLYHFIVPTDWRFLSSEQIEDLQKILFSGFVGGALTNGSKRLLK
jgi:hypothetical protein